MELRAAAPLSLGRRGDDGLNPIVTRGARQSELCTSGDVDARRRYRPLPPRARRGNRSAPPNFCQRRPRRGGKEPGGIPGARSARLEGRHRRRAAGGRAATPLPKCPLSRSDGRGNLSSPYRGGRRVRVSQPNRHIRHRSARGIGLRRAGCRVPRSGTTGRDREQSGRRARRGSQICLRPAARLR